MWKPIQSRLLRYLLPVAAVLAAMLAQAVVSLAVPKGMDFPYAFFYLLAVFIVAWYGGYLPGTIACLLTTVGIPVALAHGFRLSGLDPTRIIIFTGISLLISKVSIGQQRARVALSNANEELDKRVKSRTEDLAQAVEGLELEIVRRTKLEESLKTQVGRLSLLDQITRAIGERQDLRSIFQVVVRTLEDNLPIDFGCVCLYNADAEALTVSCVGLQSEALAAELTMSEQSSIAVDQNGLGRCIGGQLVYEPDLSQLDYPFPKRLLQGGLTSAIAAPLRSESDTFGVLIVARRSAAAFSSADCEFLRQLSEHVAVAARQAHIYTALEHAYNDLRRTQQSVMEQERLRVLGQMASGIAHDINNALSPVALYTESLLERETNLSPRTRAYLETTQRAIGDVAHTVGRMREFCRPSEPQLILMPVDLNALAGQVLDLTRARWSDMPQQRGVVISLRTELDPDLPPVAAIETEIREALTNLIFNAVDAMTTGGTLTLCTSFTAAGRVLIQVKDTGVGMDAETRRRCLEPFFTTKGERGTGLGLAMVYGMAQRQNAQLEVDSVPGEGTTVGLNFPAAIAHPEPAQVARPTTVVSRLNILLVDDDPLIIRTLQALLEEDGHRVTAATGGQQGVDTLKAAAENDEQFAVVITDLGMPYVDGRKVASAAKKACADTPVILLTGWGQRLAEGNDIPANVDRVLSKPPKLHQLRAALSELVAVSSSHAIH